MNNKFYRIMLFSCIIISFAVTVSAQNKSSLRLSKISGPEKKWAFFHIFIAKKSVRISKLAIVTTDSLKSDPNLDGNTNGGQLDAFRHAYWLALLTKEIGARKGLKLGIAHEKGNEKDFMKNRLEEGSLPDSVSCEMDLRNNQAGMQIALDNPEAGNEQLKELIIKAILNGELWIIKKDQNGNFLDCEGKILPNENLIGVWINNKCIVSSDI